MAILKKLLPLAFVLPVLASPAPAATDLSGTIRVDGSSTVFPITEAVAEEFGKSNRKVRVTVGVSGTGGGFKKFTVGESDINNASRSIKDSEKTKTKKNGIDYIEIPVAYDGLSVVVNPKNTWVDHFTVAELNKIWKPGSKVKTWKDIRPTWPNREIKLYGPGTDSGTFDYFTEAINGKSQLSRSDFRKSEDDNVLVMGVAGNVDSLGYFGYAYYIENKNKVKVVPIKEGKATAVAPNSDTINSGKYRPLSRPLYIYVSKKSLLRPEVKAFINFYLKQAPKLVKQVGYVPLPQNLYQKAVQQVSQVDKATQVGKKK